MNSSLSCWNTLTAHALLPWLCPLPSGAAPPLGPWYTPYILAARFMPAPLAPLQEMLAIMKSIYDMMGRHTYPILREDAPLEHVERFFQVSAPALGLEGQGSQRREGLLLLGQP